MRFGDMIGLVDAEVGVGEEMQFLRNGQDQTAYGVMALPAPGCHQAERIRVDTEGLKRVLQDR